MSRLWWTGQQLQESHRTDPKAVGEQLTTAGTRRNIGQGGLRDVPTAGPAVLSMLNAQRSVALGTPHLQHQAAIFLLLRHEHVDQQLTQMTEHSLVGSEQRLPFVVCWTILHEQPLRELALVLETFQEKATHPEDCALEGEQMGPAVSWTLELTRWSPVPPIAIFLH
ncbi:hypothetical protein OUZ56_025429 [Daphnia magna]|uniref:Uncharacterized protein n=1 Tax=Daphnia magna TaxID=35525 RepID=A0ABQ9ZKU6_9CRUS|nr:hypothetical protein OUZ56_025429 [Daphnia magna]